MALCGKYGAGDLKDSVTFQRVSRTTDGVGGWSEAWATLAGAPTRAKVRQLSGSEVWRFGRVEAQVRLVVVTRLFSGLAEGDRVLWRGKAHNIREIREIDDAGRWLEVFVEGGVAT